MILPQGNPQGLPLYGKQGFSGEKPLQIKVEAELQGVQSTLKFFTEYKAKMYLLFPTAYVAGAKVLHKAIGRIIPMDTGRMWNTSVVDYTGGGQSTKAFVKFVAPYSVYAHEDLSKAHGKEFNIKHHGAISRGETHARRPQEQAKFVETPSRSMVVRAAIVAAIRRVLERVRR